MLTILKTSNRSQLRKQMDGFIFAINKNEKRSVPGGGTWVIVLHNAQQTFVDPLG